MLTTRLFIFAFQYTIWLKSIRVGAHDMQEVGDCVFINVCVCVCVCMCGFRTHIEHLTTKEQRRRRQTDRKNTIEHICVNDKEENQPSTPSCWWCDLHEMAKKKKEKTRKWKSVGVYVCMAFEDLGMSGVQSRWWKFTEYFCAVSAHWSAKITKRLSDSFEIIETAILSEENVKCFSLREWSTLLVGDLVEWRALDVEQLFVVMKWRNSKRYYSPSTNLTANERWENVDLEESIRRVSFYLGCRASDRRSSPHRNWPIDPKIPAEGANVMAKPSVERFLTRSFIEAVRPESIAPISNISEPKPDSVLHREQNDQRSVDRSARHAVPIFIDVGTGRRRRLCWRTIARGRTNQTETKNEISPKFFLRALLLQKEI